MQKLITILSPAKALNFEKPSHAKNYSMPTLLSNSAELISELRNYSIDDLIKLMNISPKLAELNKERYVKWNLPFNINNSKQAISAFTGHAYQGLQADDFNENDFDFTQNNLRILSGLYGVLKPLDLIQPYRLEMGTKLETKQGKNLYEYWNTIITNEINKDFKGDENYLINLASNEYFKSIKKKNLNAEIITPQFKENKNGKFKMISVYAKKARGLMTRFIIKNQITKIEHIKAFDYEGYVFNNDLSKDNNWIFTR